MNILDASKPRLLLGILMMVGSFTTALAQWTSQTIRLNPGWNAVYLEVQPEPDDADGLFAMLPVESVWAWTRRVGGPQFIESASQLTPKLPDWETYYPPGHTNRLMRNLYQVRAGRALLVRLTGSTPVSWVVTGRPVLPNPEWVPDTPNLVGFHVSGSPATSFSDYLFRSAGHVGTNIYVMDPTGRWRLTNGLATVERGKAYWVQTVGRATFEGPLYVEPDQSAGIDFGASAVERRLLLRNDSTNSARTFTITPVPSLDRPAGATNSPARAGDVTLSYWDFSVANGTNVQMSWKPLSGPVSFTLAAGRELSVRLAVRRRDFSPSVQIAGVDAAYQSLLEVTDGVGSRVLVPVSARSAGSASGRPAGRGAVPLAGAAPGAALDASARSGLWVGSVSVTNVSWVGAPSSNIIKANPKFNFGDRTTPRPTSSEFQFRILLHLDAAGDVRLLQKVMEVWSNGTRVEDPLNPGRTLPGNPGTFRLFTDEQAASGYLGSGLRDGKPVARRLSTPIYALREPKLMVKTGGFGEGSLACSLVTGYDDNLNPFKHQYHPDHDNYNPGYSARLPAGVESYDIQRSVRLDFSADDPSGVASPGWLDNELGGVYSEAVSGVHRETIHVRGTFRIRRVSTVSTLN